MIIKPANMTAPSDTHPKVSVTVPVYNTAAFLRQCLDSLAAQTLDNIEVILINDGSTDDSPAIIDEYCRRYPWFRAIHKKNGGSASARQTGLDAARGEYVIVCDSDDWTDPDMYLKMYEKAVSSDADIVICGMIAEYGDSSRPVPGTFFEERNGTVDAVELLDHAPGMSYTKLVRRALYTSTGTAYEAGINMSEDVLITFRLLRGNPRIAQVREYLYHWRRVIGGQSYTNSIRMDHIRQMLFTYEWIKENYTDSRYGGIIRRRAIDIAFACLRASDFDNGFMRRFMRRETDWKTIKKELSALKTMMVALARLCPASLSRTIVRTLYPLFYK